MKNNEIWRCKFPVHVNEKLSISNGSTEAVYRSMFGFLKEKKKINKFSQFVTSSVRMTVGREGVKERKNPIELRRYKKPNDLTPFFPFPISP